MTGWNWELLDVDRAKGGLNAIRHSPITVSRYSSEEFHFHSQVTVGERIEEEAQRAKKLGMRKVYMSEQHVRWLKFGLSGTPKGWHDPRPLLYDAVQNQIACTLPVDIVIRSDHSGHRTYHPVCKGDMPGLSPDFTECYKWVATTLCTDCLEPDGLEPLESTRGKNRVEGGCEHDKRGGEWRKDFLTGAAAIPEDCVELWKGEVDNKSFFTVAQNELAEESVEIWKGDAGKIRARVALLDVEAPRETPDITLCYRWVHAESNQTLGRTGTILLWSSSESAGRAVDDFMKGGLLSSALYACLPTRQSVSFLVKSPSLTGAGRSEWVQHLHDLSLLARDYSRAIIELTRALLSIVLSYLQHFMHERCWLHFTSWNWSVLAAGQGGLSAELHC